VTFFPALNNPFVRQCLTSRASSVSSMRSPVCTGCRSQVKLILALRSQFYLHLSALSSTRPHSDPSTFGTLPTRSPLPHFRIPYGARNHGRLPCVVAFAAAIPLSRVYVTQRCGDYPQIACLLLFRFFTDNQNPPDFAACSCLRGF